jgi:hypothetical protein
VRSCQLSSAAALLAYHLERSSHFFASGVEGSTRSDSGLDARQCAKPFEQSHACIVVVRTGIRPRTIFATLRVDSSAALLMNCRGILAVHSMSCRGSPPNLLRRNRAYAQSSREQGCDKLSILLNGITTSVSPMVLSQHPMNHARKRARGTNAKFGLGPRVRSVYQVAPVSSMVCRGSARVTCSEATRQSQLDQTRTIHPPASSLPVVWSTTRLADYAIGFPSRPRRARRVAVCGTYRPNSSRYFSSRTAAP